MAKDLGRVSDFDPNSQSPGKLKEPSLSMGQLSVNVAGSSKATHQTVNTGSGTRSSHMSAPIKTDKG